MRYGVEKMRKNLVFTNYKLRFIITKLGYFLRDFCLLAHLLLSGVVNGSALKMEKLDKNMIWEVS